MVSTEVAYFDIQPQRDNNNTLFTDLVNVVPTWHPRTSMSYREGIDVRVWDKERHWFRKRKGLKKVKLYTRTENCKIEDEAESAERENGEFTDMMVFEGRRRFLRVNQFKNKIRCYVQWFANAEECTGWCYTPISAGQLLNITPAINGKTEMDFAPCAHNRFFPMWWLKYKNTKSQEHTPEGDWVLQSISVGTNTEWVLYDKTWKSKITNNTWYIRLNDSWMVVWYWGEVCWDILAQYWIPEGAIFVSGAMALQYQYFDNRSKCEAIADIAGRTFENNISWGISLAPMIWQTLSFVNVEGITSICAYWQVSDWDRDNFAGCFNAETYDIPWSSFRTNGITITSVALFNDRLAIMRDNNTFIIWGAGQNQSWLPAWDLTLWDKMIGIHSAPAGVTDIMAHGSYLVFLWPHNTYYYHPPFNNEFWGVFSITDRSGYFSKGSRAYKDGKWFIVRTNNEFYILEGSSYYGTVSWNWTYFSHSINNHLIPLSKTTDKINVDLTDNDTYLCIFDNNPDQKYSKIVIQNRNYNFRYTRVFDWVRITRVKDNIFFWDGVYEYTGNNDNWHSIKQIISATFGDETSQATKHFVNWRMALGKHSKITQNTKLETTVFSAGETLPRIVPITSTRYPTLIAEENAGVVKSYDIWKQILTKGKQKQHNFQTEMVEYIKYNPQPFTAEPLDKTYVGEYTSIKEAVNLPWEVIKLVISAWGQDEVEFWGMFVWYYYADFDYADISDTVIDNSELSYQSEKHTHELDKVEAPVALWHF